MRVNVDSEVATDPRWLDLAQLLDEPLQKCVGMAVFVWFPCYYRASPIISKREVDLASGREGFAQALLQARLAELIDDDTVRVLGIEDRIQWLQKQRDNGKRGGRASAGKRKKVGHLNTNSKPQGPQQQASRPSEASLKPISFSSPDPSPALSPAPATPQDPGVRAGRPRAQLALTSTPTPTPVELVKPCCHPEPGDRSQLVEFRFCQLHRDHLGMPYVHKYGRDRLELKKLPVEYDAETLLELVEYFFSHQDRFVFEQRGASIPAFVQKIPALLAAKKRNGALQDFGDMLEDEG